MALSVASFSAFVFGSVVWAARLALEFASSWAVGGSVVPSPGGIGPVEAALTAGLQVAGIPLSIGLPTAILYRLVTFWVPIPAGWLSLRRLQKVGAL